MVVQRNMMLAGVVAILVACVDASPTALPLAEQAGLAKGGGGGGGATLYKARFVIGSIPEGDGEISSDWFPAAGFSISANNPWRQVSISNVTLNLNNVTHGDFGEGQCAVFIGNFGLDWNLSNWDIAGTEPVRTYAGTWFGTVTFSKGYLAFDGDRVGGAGGIHNVVTQSNPVVETVGDNKDWFRQEVRNAPLKFGSASTPDGAPLPNAEIACANYTIELRKTTAMP
jgi:hypothetical protein